MAESHSFDRVLPSELYLLENWDETSSEDVKTQSRRLFKEFVEIGCSGRWPYLEAIRSGEYNKPTDEQVTTIFRPARSATDRAAAACLRGNARPLMTFLRTDYGEEPSYIDNWDEDDMFQVTNEFADDLGGNRLTLNDEAQYDFGDDWSQILYRIPEILGSYSGGHPDALRDAITEAKDEVRGWLAEFEAETQASVKLVNPRRRSELKKKNAKERERLKQCVHHAYVQGVLWVHDTTTALTGELLFVWLDEVGRVIRKVRVLHSEASDLFGYFFKFADDESKWWEEADIGEAYSSH
ncbi:hypothetical protein K402DRAFT_458687 [Aulographum hederae CBS 113979]|uniref:Uncharacterized protein n=1 Tax=Aulographum hederae CBS 113979 TaxID=1176131 RepID=A0A6G1HGU9_9PEZI|nr:hypothetical protein K402DRAFT_458687 [Aulographum hederae CBS 113979]